MAAANSGNRSLNGSLTDQHSSFRMCFSNNGFITSSSLPSVLGMTASAASNGQFRFTLLAYSSEKSRKVYFVGFCIRRSRIRGLKGIRYGLKIQLGVFTKVYCLSRLHAELRPEKQLGAAIMGGFRMFHRLVRFATVQRTTMRYYNLEWKVRS